MGAVGGDELTRWVKAEGGGGSAAGGGEDRILVSVRVRPLNDKELERGDPSDWECINNTTIISKNSLPERSMPPTAYTFDRVFGCEVSTRQVYEEGAKKVALSVVSGINSSIFAYGQTSSGKTYTMTGITQYSIADIYDYIQKHEEREFVLKFSAMEIYNEAVRDLLSMDGSPLRLLDDPEMEKEIKELMQQRDLAQSRLGDLLQVVGENRAPRQWDECSQSSISNVHNMSEDVLSISETSGVAYQNLGFVSTTFDASHGISNCYEHHSEPSDKPEDHHTISPCGFMTYDASYRTSNWNEHHQKLSDNPEEHRAISPRQSISHCQFNGLFPYQRREGIAQITSEDSEDHCKEVQCIEIDGSSASKNEEFNLLLTDESDSLLPLTEADKLADHGPQPLGDVSTLHASERQLVTVTKTVDNCVKKYPDESSQGSLMRDIMSSRDLALSRSRSCRASLMTSSTSWFDDIEQNNKTPSNDFRKEFPERVQRRLSTLKYTAENETLSLEGSKASDTFAFNNEVRTQDVKTASEEGITGISNFVAELKEMAQNQYQTQVPDAQETKRTTSEDFGVEKAMVKDVSLDTMSSSLEVPLQWPMEFEKKQQEIVELWHACNVSLIHRTYFFILFKGDPADSIYMEVEHRRLSFLKNSISHGNLAKLDAGDGHGLTLVSSLRNIRREREMLYRQMFKRIPAAERESLYTNWGIALNSKRRRLQLAQHLWTKTDMEHVRQSASLVAKLIGLTEPEQALKEMFGLSFTVTPQRAHRRSYSWKRRNSFVV
ncbi:putative Kinesin-like protein NACK1 [Cocos nucifera]|uniref:Putative Kinesin-like protein NACK1 n=1 Tax=Cocos nucifera TaxID=13894 RepID=A0A8K0IJQ2_COCNU|nr:putative Kinesin-like protein NACK1 [Cocos nucifera]